MSNRERIILALDVDSIEDVVRFSRLAAGRAWGVKVGLALFTRLGPRAIEAARSEGARVFLDLKLHDIPHQVSLAVRSSESLGVELLTLHSGGGEEMLRQAAAARGTPGPKLLAVTVLTSLGEADLPAVGLSGPLPDLVMRRARLAASCGMDGVVCSPREAAGVRAAAGPGFLIVAPGVRSASDSASDQKRTATAADAVAAGADLLVVGRPVLRSADPAAALERLAQEAA